MREYHQSTTTTKKTNDNNKPKRTTFHRPDSHSKMNFTKSQTFHSSSSKILTLSILLVLTIFQLATCLEFEIEARTYKCFKEELPPNFAVFGEYEAGPGYKQTIDFRVTDPNGRVTIERKDIENGDFAFTTPLGGEYTFCFFNRISPGLRHSPGLKRTVKFKLLTGSETVDYSSLAKKEHLKPVEINLRMMEDSIKTIYSEYIYFRHREASMKLTNDSTASRIFWIGVLATLIMVTSGVWQIIYLKTYFQRKKFF